MNRIMKWKFGLKICLFGSLFLFLEVHGDDDSVRKRSASYFPILMYDSDIGFGIGAKGIVKNHFYKNESFDLILFGSTKGEQWVVFTFSIPDMEIRQGTVYPVAFDLKLEFDKLLKSNFFGLGNDSENNEFQFPKEFTKLELFLNRAFTEKIVASTGLFINYTSTYRYQGVNHLMTEGVVGTGEMLTSYWTTRLYWDTRNSRIHPQKGWKLELNFDAALKVLGSEHRFTRTMLELCNYQKLIHPAHILAVRFRSQHIEGPAPYYEQSIIGGGWTGRGYKAERFIDAALTLFSAEYRMVFYKKLGGVLFTDTGRVYSSIRHANLEKWKVSWGGGLRYYLANFVARLDIGKSREGVRIFFNFGHVF